VALAALCDDAERLGFSKFVSRILPRTPRAGRSTTRSLWREMVLEVRRMVESAA
jgi:hypothetical protein